MNDHVCRSCGNRKLELRGELPAVTEFAGVPLEHAIAGGELWRCTSCRFVARYPTLAQGEYDRMYAAGSAIVWASSEARQDFRRIRAEIGAASAGQSVLDIGCYTGNFLESLPAGLRRYGVEPNLEAARIASERGVEVLAASLDALEPAQTFDYIVACDVIEHLIDPGEFLRRAQRHLKSRGKLIISTGNPDSWLWRVCGSRFWYCHFPEHISFVGPAWFEHLAASAALKVASIARFNYRYPRSGLRSLPALAAAVAYALAPSAYRALRMRLRGSIAAFSPPGCGASSDHVICALQRADAAGT